MIVELAQRAETAVTQMLAAASDGSAAATDLRTTLEMSKAIASKLAAFQARAAVGLAARERHGDGGAGVLRHATGVSRRQAEGQARTARILDDMPIVRNAVEAGRVSFTNAARLAQAAGATTADAVQADAGLLSKAESMSDDQFAREARRWAARHQTDGGEASYARRRARRSLRFWDGDDGMIHLRGELDPVTGERIRNRLEAEARRLRRSDTGSGGDRRTFTQAMGDALDGLTTVGSSVSGGGDGRGGRGDSGRGDGSRSDGGRGDGAQAGSDGRQAGNGRVDPGVGEARRIGPIADIAVVSHVDSDTGELVSQLATGEPLPQSVLELLACNAAITGVLYDTAGTPLWRGTTKRTATASQLRALVARDGGCVGCHCHPALCQAHHIKPASQGGPTRISNMVLLCWNCHYKVHHHQWTVTSRHGRFGLLPPVRTRWGPAGPLTRPSNNPRRNAAARRKPPTRPRDSHRRNTLPPRNGRRRNGRPRETGNPG